MARGWAWQAVCWWSLAGMGTALAHSAMTFGVARFLLGVGEAANFPASIKTVAEWFPKSERAFATGIFNSGTNIGAVVAPIAVPLIAATWGWRAAFVITGALGFVWLAAWWPLYRTAAAHPRLKEAERRYILDGADEPITIRTPLAAMFGFRQLCAFAVGKLLTDPVWWFYLFWLPKFLAQEHGIRGTALIPYLTTVYLIADVGSILGGYLSSKLIKLGWTVNRARKTTMGIFAAIVPSVIIASQTRSAWLAVGLIGIATACHQAWSANLFTLASDMFPRRAVGTVVGFGGFAGGIGGVLLAEFAGRVLQRDPSFYLPMFVIAGLIYLVALTVIHLLVPRLEPARLPNSHDARTCWIGRTRPLRISRGRHAAHRGLGANSARDRFARRRLGPPRDATRRALSVIKSSPCRAASLTRSSPGHHWR